MKKASSDTYSEARARKQTTKLSALFTGLRQMMTINPKSNMIAEKVQNSGGAIRSLLLVPLIDQAGHRSAQFIQALFVVHHFCSGKPGDGVILSQKNGLFRTDFFAEPAIDAANHVNFELFWKFLYLPPTILFRYFSGLDGDRSGRTNKFAELTGHTSFPTIVIVY